MRRRGKGRGGEGHHKLATQAPDGSKPTFSKLQFPSRKRRIPVKNRCLHVRKLKQGVFLICFGVIKLFVKFNCFKNCVHLKTLLLIALRGNVNNK